MCIKYLSIQLIYFIKYVDELIRNSENFKVAKIKSNLMTIAMKLINSIYY